MSERDERAEKPLWWEVGVALVERLKRRVDQLGTDLTRETTAMGEAVREVRRRLGSVEAKLGRAGLRREQWERIHGLEGDVERLTRNVRDHEKITSTNRELYGQLANHIEGLNERVDHLYDSRDEDLQAQQEMERRVGALERATETDSRDRSKTAQSDRTPHDSAVPEPEGMPEPDAKVESLNFFRGKPVEVALWSMADEPPKVGDNVYLEPTVRTLVQRAERAERERERARDTRDDFRQDRNDWERRHREALGRIRDLEAQIDRTHHRAGELHDRAHPQVTEEAIRAGLDAMVNRYRANPPGGNVRHEFGVLVREEFLPAIDHMTPRPGGGEPEDMRSVPWSGFDDDPVAEPTPDAPAPSEETVVREVGYLSGHPGKRVVVVPRHWPIGIFAKITRTNPREEIDD